MKNKKGFTLIEVLAVIVILGVIMVIAIPEISHFITRSKMDALKVSADGIVRAAELYRTGNETNDEVVKFTILNGEEIGENKLNYQGKIDSGTIMIYGENEIALCVTSGRYTALKNLDDIIISVTEGSCVFNEVTQEFETKEYCGDFKDQIDSMTTAHLEEIFNINKENADKLALIKTDYESQINTQKDAYESQILSLNTELTDLKSLGNALPANILTTKNALVKGTLINGTMSNNGALSSTLNAGETFNIPAGYTTGGTITANSLTSQTSSTATAAQILFGRTAFVNGTKLTGTMANNGALSSSLSAGQSFNIPAGYTTGGTITANSLASQTMADSTSADILSGKTAFVNGNKVTGTLSVDTIYTQQTRSVVVDINSSALASVAFDFPNKVIGLVSVSTSNANVRMASAQISGTNGAVTMLYCDGGYRITVTFVGVGY